MSNIIGQIATEKQAIASDPLINAWVNASAGSGKTKVLTDRILNLLLSGAKPEQILCITYTNVGAAEMKTKLQNKLKEWTILDNDSLFKKLKSIRPNATKEDIIKSRTLFASVLDTIGGLKIMTIHGFCQSVLKKFPLEADVSPAFEVIDEVISSDILKKIQYDLFYDKSFLEKLSKNSISPTDFEKILKEIIENRDHLNKLVHQYSSLNEAISDIYHLFDFSEDDNEESIIKKYYDREYNNFWLELEELERKSRRTTKPEKERKKYLQGIQKRIFEYQSAQISATLLDISIKILSQYNAVKKEQNYLDYDDLISYTNELLSSKDMTDWVLYKLDYGISHILLDEAQDTSPKQWEIIKKIADNFFCGENTLMKTLFVVGDKKQSIFSFQGADIQYFEKMEAYFKEKITSSQNTFKSIPFNISFRSNKLVLGLVNNVLKDPDLKGAVVSEDYQEVIHTPFRDTEAGYIEIHPLIDYVRPDQKEVWRHDYVDDIKQMALSQLVVKVVDRVEEILNSQQILPSTNQPVQPRDILILLQKRNYLMNALIRELQARSIPTGGTDKISLKDHIAIQDLMALIRFLNLPEDDLSLAEVLKGPLFNVSEEEFFELCHQRPSTLFHRISEKRPDIYELLKDYMNLANSTSVFDLFQYILNNNARQKFIQHFGGEIEEVLDIFLNMILKFEQTNPISLSGFIHWFNNIPSEIKRDMNKSNLNAVRIMTIHGAKGLEAPIVILPDTRSSIGKMDTFLWRDNLPIYLSSAEKRHDVQKELIKKYQEKQIQEHKRLLYVALTRPKDILIIFGADKNTVSNYNWYDIIKKSDPKIKDCIQNNILYQNILTPIEYGKKAEKKELKNPLPQWMYKAANQTQKEQIFSPSNMEDDEHQDTFETMALKRGTFIHQLLENLPSIPQKDWEIYIQKTKPDEIEVPTNLLSILKDDKFSFLFGPNSKAEALIMGELDNQKISGKIDRLVFMEDEIWIVDYKSNQLVPSSEDEIPNVYKTQLSVYQKLLYQIYPNKKIRKFLLWTQNLTLMELL